MLRRIARTVLPHAAYRELRDRIDRARMPAEARAEYARDQQGLPTIDPGATATVQAITNWLKRAQDRSRSADGGFARDFSLLKGWNESYPETSGYIVPTLIAEADYQDDSELNDRAIRCLDWLVTIQHDDGGFQGGTVSQTPRVSVTFNTGQILLGLAAGAQRFGDPRYLEAMHAAARFLRDSQDPDGAWRTHPTPFAKSGDKAYETHVAWGLFEAERVAPDEGYGDAGLAQVRWALTRQQENGWFADNDLEDPEHPLTHTVGYVLRGVIEAYRLSGERMYLDAAIRTADSLLNTVDDAGRIPGKLDDRWGAAAPSVCLTGSSQIAACWFLLADETGRADYRECAKLANAYVRRTVNFKGAEGQRGGVKGSYPVNGNYGFYQYLNWAAKFTLDSQRMELLSA